MVGSVVLKPKEEYSQVPGNNLNFSGRRPVKYD
jgi:hypothetical protein